MKIYLGGVNSYEELHDALTKQGSYGTVKMGRLRDLHNAQRLGSQVRKEISQRLADFGMMHLPVDLPVNQDDEVRLYVRGTAIAEVIEAVLRPTYQGDRTLLRIVMGRNNAEVKLKKIADIISED